MSIFDAIVDRPVEGMQPVVRAAIEVARPKPQPTLRTKSVPPERPMASVMNGQFVAGQSEAPRVPQALTRRPRGAVLASRLDARAREPFTRDELMLWIAAEWMLRWYGMGKRFIRVHRGGYARRGVAEGRSSVCATCPARVRRGSRHYCSASSCGCPQKAWWPFGSLGYMVWLRRVVCPRGLWPKSED